MSRYSQEKRRQTIVKAYQRNMSGPRGSLMLVRAFADPRPAVRRNTFLAGRKSPIIGSMNGEATIRSAKFESYRSEVIANLKGNQ